jgi:hypothetical protein
VHMREGKPGRRRNSRNEKLNISWSYRLLFYADVARMSVTQVYWAKSATNEVKSVWNERAVGLFRHRLLICLEKSKRIPSIFNDKSTESFICLRRHIYMSHVLLPCISFLRVLVVLYLRVTCICVA